MDNHQYAVSDADRQNLIDRFTQGMGRQDQFERAVELSNHFKDLALKIKRMTPSCREQSVVFTKLEEAQHWINSCFMVENRPFDRGGVAKPPEPQAAGKSGD